MERSVQSWEDLLCCCWVLSYNAQYREQFSGREMKQQQGFLLLPTGSSQFLAGRCKVAWAGVCAATLGKLDLPTLANNPSCQPQDHRYLLELRLQPHLCEAEHEFPSACKHTQSLTEVILRNGAAP